MAKLPEAPLPTVARIYAAYEKGRDGESRRAHLGVSTIGKPCARAAFYDFRWAAVEKHDGRMLRLFETGTLEESRFVAELRSVGVNVWTVDEATGQQWRFVDPATGGHFSGSCDGIALGFEESKRVHFLEFKTHNTKSFAKLKTKGLKEGHNQHWMQCQGYMHFSGLRWGAENRIDRTFYLAVNKDTDELYAERIKYDATAAAMLFDRAASIVNASEPPTRISEDPEFFACSYCPHKIHCHGQRAPLMNCRTCAHATAVTDRPGAVWLCAKHGHELSQDEQIAGCDDHRYIPALLTYAEPVDATEDTVVYRHRKRGFEFRNGMDGWASAELQHIDESLLDDAKVRALLDTFEGARVVEAAS